MAKKDTLCNAFGGQYKPKRQKTKLPTPKVVVTVTGLKNFTISFTADKKTTVSCTKRKKNQYQKRGQCLIIAVIRSLITWPEFFHGVNEYCRDSAKATGRPEKGFRTSVKRRLTIAGAPELSELV